MAEDAYRVELTARFLERLNAIEALTEAEAAFAFDDLLAELRATVIPNLARSLALAGATSTTHRNRQRQWHNWPRCRQARSTRCANTCMATT